MQEIIKNYRLWLCIASKHTFLITNALYILYEEKLFLKKIVRGFVQVSLSTFTVFFSEQARDDVEELKGTIYFNLSSMDSSS